MVYLKTPMRIAHSHIVVHFISNDQDQRSISSYQVILQLYIKANGPLSSSLIQNTGTELG